MKTLNLIIILSLSYLKNNYGMSEYQLKFNLRQAAENNNIEKLTNLLELNSRIDSINEALARAAQHGSNEAIKLLIKHNANINFKTKWPPLILASCNRQTKTVQLLIELGADVNVRDNHNNSTALHHAALNNWTDIIKLLLEANCDLNLKDNWGKTAMQETHVNISTEAKSLLKNYKYKNLVYKAIKENNFSNLKKYLLKIGTVCFKDKNNNNLLHYAFKENNIEIAKLIYSIKPELITQENNTKEIPLILFFNQKNIDFIKTILFGS